jgi:hypothetical protein
VSRLARSGDACFPLAAHERGVDRYPSVRCADRTAPSDRDPIVPNLPLNGRDRNDYHSELLELWRRQWRTVAASASARSRTTA